MYKHIHIKQNDQSDCAVACLATISYYYGKEVTFSKIRDLCGTDLNGTSLYGLIDASKKLGFNSKAVKITFDEIINNKIILPVIAHTTTEEGSYHYIVVQKIKKKGVIISNPLSNKRFMSNSEFLRLYNGISVIFQPNEYFETQKIEKKSLLLSFIKVIMQHKKLFLLSIISSFILTFLGIASNFFHQILIDEILPNKLRNELSLLSISFLIIGLTNILIQMLRNHILLNISQKIDIPISLGYFNHLLKLPLQFFTKRKIGDLVTRYQDSQVIKNVLSNVALTFLIDVFMILIIGTVLIMLNLLLFGLIIISCLLNLILVICFKNVFRKNNEIKMKKNSLLSSKIIESLNAIETIKSNELSDQKLEEIEESYVNLINTNYKEGLLSNLNQTLFSIVGLVISISLLWVGGYQVLNGYKTLGQLMSFISLSGLFISPLNRIVGLQLQIQETNNAMNRLSEIYEYDQEVDVVNDEKITLNSDIYLDDVSYSYGVNNNGLKNITMRVKAGSKIALVGKTGSGKTTLVKLLLNLISPTNGVIKYGEINILDISKKYLRKRISYVNQKIELFSGSINDNIRILNKEIKNEKLREVIKITDADFIYGLNNGLDTYLEEAGANLSGGERQKLSLIRALAKESDIIILDEATSNLDFMSERKILNNLFKSEVKSTIIFIAHRISSITKCDQIYVLDNGKLVEQGTHEELLKEKGYYYNQWFSKME